MKPTKKAILYGCAMVAFTLSGCANNAYTQTMTHTHKTSSQTKGATVKQAQVDKALAKFSSVESFTSLASFSMRKMALFQLQVVSLSFVQAGSLRQSKIA